MKTVNRFFLSALLVSGCAIANGQSTVDSEVPGDNFSLEGALELFKKSASPEELEKLLNSPDSKVNNLDLNNDGNIDYIRVIDRNEGNVHAFIIQAVISDKESQDVAVIELEKLADGKAVLQITGDADVYGVETIIEPTEEVRVNAGASTARAVVNVWTWPSVQYVYGPYYDPWVSPWAWGYAPIWWRPWRPVMFSVYGGWWRPYRPYYSLCYSHRIGYLPHLYRPYRSTSIIVHNHYRGQIDHYRSQSGTGSRRYDAGDRRHDRYQGYAGRSRADYQGREHRDNGNGRRQQSGYGTRDQHRSESNGNDNSRSGSDRNRNDNTRSRADYRQRESGNVRSQESSPRTYERSSRESGTPSQRNADVRQNSSERRGSGDVQQQRHSRPSMNDGARQQRSAPSQSMGRSPGRSMPSGGGRSNGNSGGRSSGNNNGGSHRSRH